LPFCPLRRSSFPLPSLGGTTATITIDGPANGNWFGVGFGATKMADAPYAIIVDGSGAVSERRLADHAPGTALAPSVTVVSSTVADGVRTVVLSRPIRGATAQHFTLPTSPGELSLITALGNTPDLAFHKIATSATIVLLPATSPACVCKPQRTTHMSYMNQSTIQFQYHCADQPRSDMLRHGDGTGRNVENMACDMATCAQRDSNSQPRRSGD